MAKESKSSVSIPAFHKMLVLAQWALGIFNEVSFENISATLKHPSLEGIDENDGHTKFYHAIINTLFYMGDGAKCTKDELAAYDLRIVGYWNQITAKRNAEEGTTYKLKYYQWLTLLVTELYLDWYFNRRTEGKRTRTCSHRAFRGEECRWSAELTDHLRTERRKWKTGGEWRRILRAAGLHDPPVRRCEGAV